MHEVGNIVEGKVTGITKFGAFVELEDGTVGMVHISEVSQSYVNDISEHLKEQQQVKVKILAVGDDNKISLSIKKAMTPPPFVRKDGGARPSNFNSANRQGGDFQGNLSRHSSLRIMDHISQGKLISTNQPQHQRDRLVLKICCRSLCHHLKIKYLI